MTTPVILLALTAVAVAWTGSAAAQDYPSRPIRMVVPFSPGGASDTAARIVSAQLASRFNQQIVIDNRPRGSGTIGVEITTKARPDGYTLIMGSNAEITINPNLYTKLPYDTARDLVPISMVASTPLLVVVHPALALKSIQDLIVAARANPDQITFASSGNGGTVHMGTQLFISMTGARLRHIPYQGGAAGLTATMAGQTNLIFVAMPLGLPQARAGKVRALAVSTAKRVPAAPEIPTVAEAGVPGYAMDIWNGLMATAGTPEPILARLHEETVRAIALPEVQAAFAKVGAEAFSSTPQAFAERVRSELATYARVVKEAGMKID